MLDNWQAMFVAAIAIVPGFLFIKAYSSVHVIEKRDVTRLIIESLSLSLAYNILLFPLVVLNFPFFYCYIFFNTISKPPTLVEFILLPFLYLFVPPLVGWAFALLQGRFSRFFGFFGFRPSTPCAWDYIFGSGDSHYVQIVLTDGKTIGGLWAHNSFASNYPNTRDLYIEKSYSIDVDGNFINSETPDQLRAEGIWIPSESIKYIEFFSAVVNRERQ